jgi:hypothetical protein
MNPAMAEALQDTRWLLRSHRQMLAAGALRLPHRGNHFGDGGHPAVLMSIPDEICGFEVAWIDFEIAKLVWLLNLRHGLTTIESCQGTLSSTNGGVRASSDSTLIYTVYYDDPYDEAYLAFKRRRDCTKFLALAGDSLRGEQRYYWGRDVRFGHSLLARITQTVEDTTP